MIKKELPHFLIGGSYGGNQDWFRTFMMRIGGCGAETACDSSIYFALHKGLPQIIPFDSSALTRESYVDFAHLMEKYLWPRMTGIDRTQIFIDGYAKYLKDRGVSGLSMTALDGSVPFEKAAETVRRQIDSGYPIPTLILRHRDKMFDDYTWHWFLINGYAADDNDSEISADHQFMVKAVTYSEYRWLDLRGLWDTGFRRRGGFVLYHLD